MKIDFANSYMSHAILYFFHHFSLSSFSVLVCFFAMIDCLSTSIYLQTAIFVFTEGDWTEQAISVCLKYVRRVVWKWRRGERKEMVSRYTIVKFIFWIKFRHVWVFMGTEFINKRTSHMYVPFLSSTICQHYDSFFYVSSWITNH